MDIFAHGLWTGAAYKALNNKRAFAEKNKLSIKLAVFWGVFPDLFAFTVPFAIIFYNIFFGSLNFSDFPKPDNTEPPGATGLLVMSIAQRLYNVSHSLVIFAVVFLIVYFIFRRMPVEMLGWAFHIFIDIPTHTYEFFPTRVFWPIFGWKFSGISWGEPWFMALNYGGLAIVYFWLNKGVFHRWRRNEDGAVL